MKRFAFALVFLITLSGASHAKYFTSLGGPGVKVTKYFVHTEGGVTLYISGNIINADECMATDKVHLKGNLPGHNSMVAAVLAAFASGKNVGFFASGCEIIPFWGGTQTVAIVSNLWVIK